MMLTTWKVVIHRLPGSFLLFTSTLWAVPPANTDAANSTDLSQVRTLAAQGSIRDEIILAGDYFTGTGVKQDIQKAAYWYEKAAGHGNPDAQNEIGYFYQAGIGVPKDNQRALHWYQLSAASGCSQAKVNLAIGYLFGVGIRKDEELAVRLLNQAFQQGNGTAASYLGLLYFFGIAVKADKPAGEKWFEAAEKLHDPLAAFNLGSLYSVDQDHPHDFPKAAALLGQAADAGYVPAMHALGLLLVNHPELKQDSERARTLLQTAENAGSWKSSVVLGILARDGRGIPVDYPAAYFHLRVAALQGGADAERLTKHDLESLAGKIGADECRKQASAVNSWHQSHPIAFVFVYKAGAAKGAFPATAVAYASDGSIAGQLIPLSSS